MEQSRNPDQAQEDEYVKSEQREHLESSDPSIHGSDLISSAEMLHTVVQSGFAMGY